MEIKFSKYLWVGLLVALSGNVLAFDVTPKAPTGDEGSNVPLTISVDAADWIFDDAALYCSSEFVFTIDMTQQSGAAVWSNDGQSGDFHFDESGSVVSQSDTLVFCSPDPIASSYQGYSLRLHNDAIELEGDEGAQIDFTGACNDGNSMPFPCTSGVALTIVDTTQTVYAASINATSPNAAEPNIDGEFTISIDKPAGPDGLQIYYGLSGLSTATSNEDFAAFGTSLTIASGETSAVIPVVVLEDVLLESDETVIVDLAFDGYNPGSPTSATVTIADDDELPVVNISSQNAAEPGPPGGSDGSFTFTLDGPAPSGGLSINYVVSSLSTATNNEDYLDIGDTIVIAAGQTSASIPLVVIDDELVEGTETVVADILSSSVYDLGSQASATADIIDDDSPPLVSVTASRAEEPGQPDGNDGKFTFTLDQPAVSTGLTVNYTVLSTSTATSGADYEALSMSVDFPAGADSIEVPVVVIDDDLHEGSESVILEIQSGADYETGTADSATVFIVDDESAALPNVSVSASDAAEPSSNGSFRFSLSAPAPEGGITIDFALSPESTATQSADFQALPTSVSIAAGSNFAEVPVVVIDDGSSEGPETVEIEIQAGSGYEAGSPASATLTIADDDNGIAGLQVSNSSLTTGEDGTADQFGVSLLTQPSADVVVNVASNDPSEGMIEPSGLMFNASNWSSPQVVTVTGVDDVEVDGNINYTVLLTTSSTDNNYASLDQVQVLVSNIDNDEGPVVEFPQATISVTEDVGEAEVTIKRAGSGGSKQLIERPVANNEKLANSELTVTFSTDDSNPGTTATPGVDYTPVNEVLVWPAGDFSPRTINISLVNDADVEGDETIVLKLDITGSDVPVYSDLVVSNDFVEEVISNINPDDLPLNQQSITEVILTSCPTGLGQGGFQELCTDLVVEALEGGSVLNPLIAVTPDDAAAARTPATQTQTVQNINVNGRQSALRGGASGLSMQGFTVGMAGFNMNAGMFKNFGSGYDSIQADATNPFSSNYLSNSLVSNKANASDDDGDDFGKWGVWVSGKAIFGDKNGTVREQGYDFDTAGLTVGVDYRFTDNLVAGAAFGYANNGINMDNKGGKLDTTGLTSTIYGSYYPTANFYMDASFSLGMNDYQQTRNVIYQLSQINASVNEQFKADYDGDQTSFTFGTGYDFNNDGWVFGPTLFVEYIDIDVDAFDEKLISSTNPGFTLGWATHINKQKYESLIPQIGVQLSKAFSQTWGVIVPTAHVSWAKELKSDNSIVSGYFLGDVGQVNFNLLTDDLDEDFFKAGVGLSAMFQNNKSAFISVDGDFGRELLSVYYVNAGFRWEF